MKRLIIAAVGVVGLVVIGLGVASATVWRADDVLVAGTSGGPHTLVTDPGVLELGGDPVTVHVTVPDKGQVTLAIGRDTDVAGWVGTEAHGQVTGLDELARAGRHGRRGHDARSRRPRPDRPGCRRSGTHAHARRSDAGADAATAVDPGGLRPVGRPGDRQGLGDPRVAAAGGPLEPHRREHGRVRTEPDDGLAPRASRRRCSGRPSSSGCCSCSCPSGSSCGTCVGTARDSTRSGTRSRPARSRPFSRRTSTRSRCSPVASSARRPRPARRVRPHAPARSPQVSPPLDDARGPHRHDPGRRSAAQSPRAARRAPRRRHRRLRCRLAPRIGDRAEPVGRPPVRPAGRRSARSGRGARPTDGPTNGSASAAPADQDGPHGRPSWLTGSSAAAAGTASAPAATPRRRRGRAGTAARRCSRGAAPPSRRSAPRRRPAPGAAAARRRTGSSAGPLAAAARPRVPATAPVRPPAPRLPCLVPTAAPAPTRLRTDRPAWRPGRRHRRRRRRPVLAQTPGAVRRARRRAGRVEPGRPDIRTDGVDPAATRRRWQPTRTRAARVAATTSPAARRSRPPVRVADAWRRAWGLPSIEDEPNPPRPTTDDQEDGR